MPIQALRDLVRDEMNAVDAVILEQMRSDVPLIPLLGQYIVQGGGKRLRPLLLVAMARMLGYRGERDLALAAVVEFIHTATLLHDDVVDESNLRRGRDTANAVWGNQASVLVGDFLFSRACEMMVGDGDIRVLQILSTASRTLAEGEVLQLAKTGDLETTEEDYNEVIRCKTAALFDGAARVGAVVAGVDSAIEEAAAAFGSHIGYAFQLVDDALDCVASAAEMGKSPGDDIRDGKMTLPVIHALQYMDAVAVDRLGEIMTKETPSDEDVHWALSAVESCGGVAYTLARAGGYVDLALEALVQLPPSPIRDQLEEVARFTLTRRS